MVNRMIPAPDVGRKRSAIALRRTVAVLLATTALGVVSAHAVDGTWLGGGDEWTDPTHWSSNPDVPDGTATFVVNEPTTIQNTAPVAIGTVLFTSSGYTINTNDIFVVNGTGIFRNTANAVTFNVNDSFSFQNSSTASGGTNPVVFNNNGFMTFRSGSTAGTAQITNNAVLEFFDASTAGSAQISNKAAMNFFGAASAGSANITNAATGTLTFNDISSASGATITLLAPVAPGSNSSLQFNDSSSAGSAAISTTLASFATITFNNDSTAGSANITLVDGTLVFNNSSTAGSATVTMTDPMHPGSITFNDTASAGTSNITNVANLVLGSSVKFLGASTAGNATIANNPGAPAGEGGTLFFGTLGGTDTSDAGTAHITNNQFGSTSFLAHTSAMNATIVNNNGGNTNFQDQSTAGNATIVNNSGGTTGFGVPLAGTDTASAGSSVIINNSGGTTAFFAATTAGSATIINSLGGIVQFGDSGGANDTATAGSSTIDNSGNVSFNSKTTAGNATITTHSGGNVFFFDTSSGGGARFITDAGGTVDISALTSAGTTAGSIEGAGSYVLGAKNFAVGSNNLTTEVSGVISGVGGSLTKVGTGTLILSGTNTYTGGTTISAGTLQLGSGGTTGSIVGNVVDNGILAVNRSNAVTLSGVISGSGAFQQLGTGTTTLTADNNYTGGTTISAGTLRLGDNGFSGLGSIQGNVVDNAVLAMNHLNTFTFSGVISGSGALQQIGNGTTILTTANTYTGPTTVTVGTLTIASTGSITSNVTNNTVFNNAGTVTGSLNNISTGIATTSGTITNGVTNAGQVAASGVINGAITNNGGVFIPSSEGKFLVLQGNLVGNSTFTNNDAAILFVDGSFTGITTLTNNAHNGAGCAGTCGQRGIVVTAGSTLSANAVINSSVSTIQNSGTLSSLTSPLTSAGELKTATAASVINGGLINTGTVTAAGAVNGVIANNAGTFTVTGNLSSDSSFTNAAGATLAVGASTYTLQGLLTNSGAVTVANGATLNATTGGITNNASGTITVAVGGTVKDDLNNAGVTANNGAYLANVATNTGTITNNGIWTGNVASNAGIITNNLTWTGTVSNAGTFNNNAGATVSGLLTNTAGTTTNNGALNGGASVSGGTFTGAGTVTNLTVSGGTFAPGSGTPGSSMTVTGNLAFQSGAMYLVTLNPTTASFASVGGTASLNGTAAAVYLAGNYISKKYTILSAAGGVTGTFGSLVNTNVPANFTSTLSYDANNAYIDLTLNLNPAPNFGSGLNINQQNVANTLVNFFNTTGGIPLVFGTLTPAGLTQASGELGTGVIQSSIKANDMFLNLLLDPSVAGRAGGFASGGAASQFAAADEETLAYAAKRKASSAERDAYAMATKAPYLVPQPVGRWSVWGAAYGGSATTDGNTIVGSHDTTARAYGVVGGADYKVSPDALIGFALAGGGTNFSIASALGGGNSDMFQAGVFGRQNISAAYLSAALAYGWQDVTTNRTVTIAGTDMLRANFKAETFSARFEGGYRFATPWAGITPYVAAQVISFNLPAYAEQVLAGTGTFALNYGAQTTTATRTELGLRTDKSYAMQDGIFTLRGRATWAHDYNSDRAVSAVFQTLPGAAFVVNGARANPDGALVSAGAEMKWINGFSLAATFEGEFSSNTTSYAGKGVAKYTW